MLDMSIARYALIGCAVVGGGALAVVTGGAAAPIVGSLLGGAMGLSGAAATSAGLAAIGGGSLAAGGAGMAGGAAVVAGVSGAAGAIGAGVLASKVPVERRCRSCDVLVERTDKVCGNCGSRQA